MKKIIVAIDSFKGCFSSNEVETIVAETIRQIRTDYEIVNIPISDGGEGFLDAYCASGQYKHIDCESYDAMMRKISTHYEVSNDNKTAIIESALTCGISLLKKDELNPLVATSYGLGIVMVNAIRRGVNKMIIGLGGSATSDCGIGMLQALIDHFCPNRTVYELRETLKHISPNLQITVASDVTNPLYGINGAAKVFGRQKGADETMIELLDRRAITFANMAAKRMKTDYAETEGAGAAGGIGYAMIQFFGAKITSGIDLVLDNSNFSECLRDCCLVITGEGKADSQTISGKAPVGIIKRVIPNKTKTLLIAGQVSDYELLYNAGFNYIISLHKSEEKEIDLDASFNQILLKSKVAEFFRHSFQNER